jgi:hypothetical protein
VDRIKNPPLFWRGEGVFTVRMGDENWGRGWSASRAVWVMRLDVRFMIFLGCLIAKNGFLEKG